MNYMGFGFHFRHVPWCSYIDINVEIPEENNHLTPSHWQPSRVDSCPGNGERQLAISANALNHSDIGACLHDQHELLYVLAAWLK